MKKLMMISGLLAVVSGLQVNTIPVVYANFINKTGKELYQSSSPKFGIPRIIQPNETTYFGIDPSLIAPNLTETFKSQPSLGSYVIEYNDKKNTLKLTQSAPTGGVFNNAADFPVTLNITYKTNPATAKNNKDLQIIDAGQSYTALGDIKSVTISRTVISYKLINQHGIFSLKRIQ